MEYFTEQLKCCIKQAFVGSSVLASLGTPEVLMVDDWVPDSDSDAPPAHKWLISGAVAGVVAFFLLVSRLGGITGQYDTGRQRVLTQ